MVRALRSSSRIPPAFSMLSLKDRVASSGALAPVISMASKEISRGSSETSQMASVTEEPEVFSAGGCEGISTEVTVLSPLPVE